MFSDIQAKKKNRHTYKKKKPLCFGNKKSEVGKAVCLTGMMLLHLLCFHASGGSFMYHKSGLPHPTFTLTSLIPPPRKNELTRLKNLKRDWV